jgi:DNA-binding XRE family transcriptional regulator
MARDIDDFIAALPAAERREIDKRFKKALAEELSLQELRRAQHMTQVKMAKKLGIAQKQISEIEKRTDMHISTLRRSVEALGGKLSLIAEFPDRPPVILTGIASQDV